MGSCSYRVEIHCRDSIEQHGAGPPVDSSLVSIGPVPETRRYKIVKGLSGCFTHRDNPHRSKTPSEHFQRELDELIEGDAEYSAFPTLPKLCDLVARLIHKWEKLHHEYVSHSVSLGSTSSTSTLGKRDRQSKTYDQGTQGKSSDKDGDNPLCQGCNRFGHTRETWISTTPVLGVAALRSELLKHT